MIKHNDGGFEIDRKNMTITVLGKRVQLAAYQKVGFKAVEHLLLVGPKGATREEIYDVTHGHCPDGGTNGGPHDVHVWLTQSFLPLFSKLGVKVIKRKDPSVDRVRYSLRVV